MNTESTVFTLIPASYPPAKETNGKWAAILSRIYEFAQASECRSHQFPGKPLLYISPLLAQYCFKSELKSHINNLCILHNEGKLEIVVSYYAEPLAFDLPESLLERQLTYALTKWKEFGLAHAHTALISDTPSPLAMQVMAKHHIANLLVIGKSSLKTDQSTISPTINPMVNPMVNPTINSTINLWHLSSLHHEHIPHSPNQELTCIYIDENYDATQIPLHLDNKTDPDNCATPEHCPTPSQLSSPSAILSLQELRKSRMYNDLVTARISSLSQQLERWITKLGSEQRRPKTIQQLAEATALILETHSRLLLDNCILISNLQQLAANRHLWRLLSTAQVICDNLEFPESDPSEGWARFNYSSDLFSSLPVDNLTSSPNICQISTTPNFLTVDTQFINATYAPAPTYSLLSMEYKPRKLNLLPEELRNFPTHPKHIFNHHITLDDTCRITDLDESFFQQLASTPVEITETSSSLISAKQHPSVPHTPSLVVTKNTPGLVGLRTYTTTNPHPMYKQSNPQPATPSNVEPNGQPSRNRAPTQLCLATEYSYHAALGGHRPNSTTGFQVEYWIEGTMPPALNVANTDILNTVIINTWHIALPSERRTCYAFKALFAVGGTSDEVYQLQDSLLLHRNTSGQVIHGVRIVDSLDHFIIDFRWARPILACYVSPNYLPTSNTAIHSLQLTFALEAKRMLEIDRAATLFVSIN